MTKPKRKLPESLTAQTSDPRAWLDSLGCLAISLSPNGTILNLNPRMAEILGHPAEELVGTRLWPYLLPADRAWFQATTTQVATEGKTHRQDACFAGRWYDTCWTPGLNGQGEVVGVALAGWDITERKLTEQALQDKSDLFSLLLRYSPVYAFIKEVTPTESRVLTASENYQDMIGVPGSQMVGRTMEEVFPPDFAAKITADDWAVVSSGTVLKLDEDLNGRNYTTIKFPIVQGGKHLLAGYTIDITDRKQAEAEREKIETQNRQLQKAESLGRMAGAIAHHFNNQLQAVMGNVELAMHGLCGNPGPIRHLAEAIKSTRKAADVSRMMLAYLGQSQGRRDTVDLSDVCEKSLALVRAAMPSSVILETKLPSPGPAIQANSNQVQQVLTNLLTNAWEASVDGKGTVKLAVKIVAATDVPKSSRFPIDWQPRDSVYACLEVADKGCGIPSKDIENIFDPFFSTKFTGRGLGLPVVLGIVRAHGGSIVVKSRLGRGSLFQVFWPLSTEAAVPQLQPAGVDQRPQIPGAGTVLVVEDDPIVRQTVALFLAQSGLNVLEASDGAEGVEVFREHQDQVDCVLCDLTMPRMDGWETLTAIRHLAPGLPFLLSSGYSEAQTMAGHHPELPQAFLSKPYDFTTLGDTLARVMRRTGTST